MEIHDFIEFNVYGKKRRIELCLGDITKLSIKDSVNLLLLSAFHDDYSPVKGSLIGALYDEMNLSVKSLAKDKAEDLRNYFNCWISKELPSRLPFRRILCFEQNSTTALREDPSNLVGAMFRALFTTFKNEEWSMITPILATGYQRTNKTKMINEMVRACSAWISAEMPLTCMKIVIFKGKGSIYLNKDDNQAIEEFRRLKSEINWKPYKNLTVIKYDALFLFVKEDEDIVNIFLTILLEYFTESSIKVKLKCLNRKDSVNYSTNYDTYEKFQRKMLESKKVGLFLSNDFLNQPRAIEVYNLALCLTQKTKKSLLTPVCLKRLNDLPEYMSLNQWIDCRIKDGKEIEEQLRVGAESFVQIINNTQKYSNENDPSEKCLDSKENSVIQDFINFNYDIFISYSHKDDKKCKIILQFLQFSLPNARIFYDKNDIKTGFSWQEIIYNSLNGSKIVLALLSENYIQSPMCHEEFSIAISQDWSPQYDTKLFPIWISEKCVQSIITDYPNQFQKLFLMNNIFVSNFLEVSLDELSSDMQMISLFQVLLDKIIRPYLLGQDISEYHCNPNLIDLDTSAAKARTDFFYKTWSFNGNFTFSPIKNQIINSKNITNKPNDIAIGFSTDDSCYANYLKRNILKINKDLKIILCSMGHHSNEWQSLKDIETAYAMVILLKPYYIMTKSCRDQLHIALSLQRKYGDSGPIVIPILLETLPQNPSYFHLIPSRFKADDEMFLVQTKNVKLNPDSESNSFIYDVKVSKRMAVMLTFAAHWIAEGIFVQKIFNPPKSFVIYSTFDLINTSFNVPLLIDFSISNEIKTFNISKHEVDLANTFLMKNPKIVNNPNSRSEIDDQSNSHEQSLMKAHSITRVCVIM